MTNKTPQREQRSPIDGRYCGYCGYALKGMSADQKCPECGVPVQATLDGNLIWHVPESYRRRLRIGWRLIAIACFAFAMNRLIGAIGFLRYHADPRLVIPDWVWVLEWAIWGSFLAINLFFVVAVFAVTTPTPYQTSINRWNPALRFWLRAATLSVYCWSTLPLVVMFTRVNLFWTTNSLHGLLANRLGQSVFIGCLAMVIALIASVESQADRTTHARRLRFAAFGAWILMAIALFEGRHKHNHPLHPWPDPTGFASLIFIVCLSMTGALAERLAHMLREKNNPASTPNADA
ncbi:MAG: hypothetical protein AAF432_02170 [Planctomycetota bacterium]